MEGERVMQVEWAGASVCGTRKEPNQDVWAVIGDGVYEVRQDVDSGKNVVGSDGIVFAVSDGMGGREGGGIASNFVIHRLRELLEGWKGGEGECGDCEAFLERIFLEIHAHLRAKGAEDAELCGMGATLVLGWLRAGQFHVANLGDSRLYRLRAGRLEQLSKDFTFAWSAWKREEMCEAEYRQHPRRAALYGALGGGQGGCSPFIETVQVERGDRLLLCSDGVIDGVWERKLEMYLREARPVKEVRDTLFRAALEGAGGDDTTALLLEIVQ